MRLWGTSYSIGVLSQAPNPYLLIKGYYLKLPNSRQSNVKRKRGPEGIPILFLGAQWGTDQPKAVGVPYYSMGKLPIIQIQSQATDRSYASGKA